MVAVDLGAGMQVWPAPCLFTATNLTCPCRLDIGIKADEANTKQGEKLEPVVNLTDMTPRQRHTAKNKYKLQKYSKEYHEKKKNMG